MTSEDETRNTDSDQDDAALEAAGAVAVRIPVEPVPTLELEPGDLPIGDTFNERQALISTSIRNAIQCGRRGVPPRRLRLSVEPEDLPRRILEDAVGALPKDNQDL
jgi:hypothetical protein